MTPPIPARLAGRPLHAGLVVPWVSVVLGDGTAVLGNMHGAKANRALMNKLCQICGQRLEKPLVLFASESSLRRGQTSEPGMHPECAAYSAKACPMVNGAMRRYQTTDRVAGKPCDKPGCDCGGWVSTDHGTNAGAPAEPWFAVWVDDYAIGVDPVTGVPNAAIWGGYFTPRRIRPIPQPGRPAQEPEEAHQCLSS